MLLNRLKEFSTEQRIAAVSCLGVAYYALENAKQIREERLKKNVEYKKAQRLPSAKKLQDHPLISWLITNASVVSLVYLKHKLIGSLQKEDSDLKNFFKLWGAGVLHVEGAMLISWFLTNKVYAHIPFFSNKQPKQTLWEIFTDYLKCNTVVNVVGALVQMYLYRQMRGKSDGKFYIPVPQEKHFRPLRFLFRLMFIRVIFDAAFYAGHYFLHKRELYQHHKRHHEHNQVKLTTNYHFSPQDLLIEAFIPLFLGISVHEGLIGPIHETELNVIAVYCFWHEIQSHAGKALPTMSILPPIAPLFQYIDDYNCWHHHIHHSRLKYNFGISPWLDLFFNTAMWT